MAHTSNLSEHQINQVTMLINQDVILDNDTSHMIDIPRFLKEDAMYALTRQLPKRPCDVLVDGM